MAPLRFFFSEIIQMFFKNRNGPSYNFVAKKKKRKGGDYTNPSKYQKRRGIRLGGDIISGTL